MSTYFVPRGSLNATLMSAKLMLNGKYTMSGTSMRSPMYGRKSICGLTMARAVEFAMVCTGCQQGNGLRHMVDIQS